MIIEKRSILTGNINSMDLDVTENQLEYWKASGEHIQDLFPHLTADQREFLISGCTKEEWDDAFGDE